MSSASGLPSSSEAVSKLFFLAVEFGHGREKVLTLQQKGNGDVFEEIVAGAVEHASERDDAIELGDGAMNHGRDDVVIVDFFFKEIGNAEDELGAVDVVFETSEGQLLVGTHDEFESEGKALLVEFHGRLRHDGEGVEIGEGLGVQVDVGMVGLESSGQDLAPFHGFTVPALSPEGIDDGMKLP